MISLVSALILCFSLLPQQEVTVERVFFGDVIEVSIGGEKQEVHLLGVDAPSDPNDPNTISSRAYMEDLLRDGKTIIKTEAGKPDWPNPRGYIWAYVELPDGTDCGEKLVEAGWATAYMSVYPCARTEQYFKLMQDAKESERGMWYER